MQIGNVLLDALVDTAKILPVLFIAYYLIELIEFKFAFKLQNNKWLKGKASPLVGSAVGCIPQCGFSVISTDLYTKKAISVGALVAVYLATSDEALPIMFSNPQSIPWLFALIGVKVLMGIVVGYISMGLYNLIFKSKSGVEKDKENFVNSQKSPLKNENLAEKQAKNQKNDKILSNVSHEHSHDENAVEAELLDGGCCHHHVKSKSFDWLHPLLHCLKISAFILIINILFGLITQIWIGEEALTNFMSKSLYVQPLVAILIGLIPNCASSVAITELFLMGGLSFGALCAGLCVNAGLGLTLLIKQNKSMKENIFIILMLIVPSLILGYALNFI